jgi:N utilization substance protein B
MEQLSETEIIECKSLSLRDQRSMMLHLLYAMDSFDYQASLDSIVDNFSRGFGYSIARAGAVFSTTSAVIDSREQLDEQLKPYLDNWRFERIGSCTRLILRLALWEIKEKKLTPTIVINEAIELAKSFAEPDAYKFINGVLDKFLTKH